MASNFTQHRRFALRTTHSEECPTCLLTPTEKNNIFDTVQCILWRVIQNMTTKLQKL